MAGCYLFIRLLTTLMNFMKQAECDEHLEKLERFLNEFIQIRLNA